MSKIGSALWMPIRWLIAPLILWIMSERGRA